MDKLHEAYSEAIELTSTCQKQIVFAYTNKKLKLYEIL